MLCKDTLNHEELALSLRQLIQMTNYLSESINQWNKLIAQKDLADLTSEFNYAEEHAANLSEQLEVIQIKLKRTSDTTASSVTFTEF